MVVKTVPLITVAHEMFQTKKKCVMSNKASYFCHFCAIKRLIFLFFFLQTYQEVARTDEPTRALLSWMINYRSSHQREVTALPKAKKKIK